MAQEQRKPVRIAVKVQERSRRICWELEHEDSWKQYASSGNVRNGPTEVLEPNRAANRNKRQRESEEVVDACSVEQLSHKCSVYGQARGRE